MIKNKDLVQYSWGCVSEQIETKTPKYSNIPLEEVDIDVGYFLVTTEKFTHLVYDDYMGEFGQDGLNDPLGNGLKTEEDYKLWLENTYSRVRVREGVMRHLPL
ncbi:MAG: hypothetical protein QXU18_00355 [Thermoplasmatales archaeon]